jgi:hypothetical protein
MSEHDAAREIIRELLHEALAGANGSGVTPQIPPPPVAAVHRPSTWSQPQGVRPLEDGRGLERVTLTSDADLDRFVRSLVARPPEELDAIRAGRLRFTLKGPSAGDGVVRVERGAVTERKVEEAAKAGGRLVLGPGAVLTPLARDKARAKGIQIERER